MRETLTRRRFSMGLGMVLAARLVAHPSMAGAADTTGAGLAAEWSRIEARSGGRLGVAVHDTGTGRRIGHRSGEPFPMCSTFKVLACGAVLARVDAGREDLDRRIRFEAGAVVTYSPITKDRVGGHGMTLAELCEAAMTWSDNTAANLILASLGGPSAVTAFARSIGDPVTRLDRIETGLDEATPGDLRDTTTPDAMAADLRWLVVEGGLSQQSRDRLSTWLLANQTGGAKLRAGLQPGWRIGDKTGGGDYGTTNDVAVIWPPGRKPLIVCVYLTDTKASFEACNATIAAIGQTVGTAITREN